MPDDASPPHDTPRIDPRVLELLVCPDTRTNLEYKANAQMLVSPRPRLAYQILNGVPILVRSEARELDDTDPLLKRST